MEHKKINLPVSLLQQSPLRFSLTSWFSNTYLICLDFSPASSFSPVANASMFSGKCFNGTADVTFLRNKIATRNGGPRELTRKNIPSK
jgi:hypothetical protein